MDIYISLTGSGLVIGTIGPLSLSVFVKKLQPKDQIIASRSVFVIVGHLEKIPIFTLVTSALFKKTQQWKKKYLKHQFL